MASRRRRLGWATLPPPGWPGPSFPRALFPLLCSRPRTRGPRPRPRPWAASTGRGTGGGKPDLDIASGPLERQGRPRSFFKIDQLAQTTGLERDAVRAALAGATARGIVLTLDIENDQANTHCYAINTEETASLARYDDSWIEHVPGPAEPAQRAEGKPATPATMPQEVAARPIASKAANETSIVSLAVVGRLTALLGRDLTKDEVERIKSLRAADAAIFAAIESVQARRLKLYTSDQVIYEYERLQREMRAAPVERAVQHGVAREKTRSCTKCGGTGYIFHKANSVRVCDCKK